MTTSDVRDSRPFDIAARYAHVLQSRLTAGTVTLADDGRVVRASDTSGVAPGDRIVEDRGGAFCTPPESGIYQLLTGPGTFEVRSHGVTTYQRVRLGIGYRREAMQPGVDQAHFIQMFPIGSIEFYEDASEPDSPGKQYCIDGARFQAYSYRVGSSGSVFPCAAPHVGQLAWARAEMERSRGDDRLHDMDSAHEKDLIWLASAQRNPDAFSWVRLE